MTSISSGPRPQLAPDGVRSGRRQAGHRVARADAHHRAQVGVEAHRDHDRQVGRDLPGRGQRGLGLAEVAQRLDQHQVDPALDQRRELLGEQRLGLLGRHGARAAPAAPRSGRGRRPRAARARRPPTARSAPRSGSPRPAGRRGRACPAAGGCRRRCWSSAAARPASAYAACAARTASRVLEVPELAGCAVLEAAVLEQRAHAAVEQHRTGRRPAAPRAGSSAQPVEVAGDPVGRPLRVELGGDPVEHLGRRAVRRGPRGSGPSPRGSRRRRCPRAASRPRRSPPGSARPARPSRSRRPPGRDHRRQLAPPGHLVLRHTSEPRTGRRPRRNRDRAARPSGQAEDGPVVGEVDPRRRGLAREPGHGHHVAADQDDEAGAGGEPDLADVELVARAARRPGPGRWRTSTASSPRTPAGGRSRRASMRSSRRLARTFHVTSCAPYNLVAMRLDLLGQRQVVGVGEGERVRRGLVERLQHALGEVLGADAAVGEVGRREGTDAGVRRRARRPSRSRGRCRSGTGSPRPRTGCRRPRGCCRGAGAGSPCRASTAPRSSVPRSVRATPPWYLRARTVATTTATSGRSPDLRHLMSTNFSAPRSAPKPASVTTMSASRSAGAGGHHRAAPVRDVGERAAVHEGGRTLQRSGPGWARARPAAAPPSRPRRPARGPSPGHRRANSR